MTFVRKRSLRPPTVRGWVMVALIGLAVLALTAAGYVAYLIQEGRVEIRVDESLLAQAEELRVLADNGVDPETGARFDSPEDLVREATGRTVPARNGGTLGLVDGSLAYTSPVAPVSLEDDAELVRALEGMDIQEPVFRTVTTESTVYRVAYVPVTAVAAESPQPDTSSASLVLAYDLSAEKRAFSEIFLIYAAVSAALVLVISAVAWVVAGRLLRPVRVLADAARSIGREDLSERIPVRGNDDLAEMTRSVNGMLERLEAAFTAQRQLVNDVSHELRTPLTVISGHLEVMEIEDWCDVRDTRELALDEIERMNRVIDDLLTLATTEQPGFVRVEPTEIGPLMEEVFDKVSALGPQQWVLDQRTGGEAELDRQRITQAVLQLAANAAKFAPDDSTVCLGSQRVLDGVEFWVRDEGPGIAEEDRRRIFERFERVNFSAPGAGLGLPIVAAIARAHGGEVRCESGSGDGEGTSFVIKLPSEPTDSGEAGHD